MNSISIDNEKYVKATDIARELGYTADYVGQLCRAKKVDAQLVGRSWYVSEESIREHKKNRYRNTKSLHKKTISTSLNAKSVDTQNSYPVSISVVAQDKISRHLNKKFYTHLPEKSSPAYFSDEADLIPQTPSIKTGRLTVELGDSLPVKIISTSHQFDFKPEAREVLKFKGALKVTDVYEENVEQESITENSNDEQFSKKEYKPQVLKTKSSRKHADGILEAKNQKTYDKASKIKVKHLRKERPKVHKPKLSLERNLDGIIGMTTRKKRVVGGTLKVSATANTVSPAHTGILFFYISISTALALAFFMIGMEVSIFSEGTESSLSYTFTFDNLLASVAFFR